MKTLVLFFVFLSILSEPQKCFATISELQITKGASFVDTTSTTPIVYGGMAGLNVASPCSADPDNYANNLPCNTCKGLASPAPCNENSVYPDLQLKFEFKTDQDYSAVTSAKIRFQAGSSTTVNFDPDSQSDTLSANTVLTAIVSWSKICNALGKNTNCSADMSSPETIKIGIESAGNFEESANFQVHLVGNSITVASHSFHSDCGTGQALGENEGFCYFRLLKGDGKAFIRDETTPESTYNRAISGLTYKYVRFYYEAGNPTCTSGSDFSVVTPNSDHYDITTSNDGPTYFLDDDKLGGLENGTRYYFRMANIDVAGNIFYFSNNNNLRCDEHSVVPEEVMGLLDNKHDFSCFIATAAYGSTMAPDVDVLREFRDRFLKTNDVGRRFVSWYYAWSPKYANWIKKKTVVKTVVRGLLWPVVMFAKFTLWSGISGLIIFMISGFFFSLFALRRLKNRV